MSIFYRVEYPHRSIDKVNELYTQELEEEHMAVLNKKDLIRDFAEKSQITQKDATTYVNDLLELVTQNFEEGNTIDIAGFGKFEVRERAARKGINPATKEPVEIPASKTIKFSLKKALKEAINK